jgi:hypothetical protein
MRFVENDTQIDLAGIDHHLFILVCLFSGLLNDKRHAIDGEAFAYIRRIHDGALECGNTAGGQCTQLGHDIPAGT